MEIRPAPEWTSLETHCLLAVLRVVCLSHRQQLARDGARIDGQRSPLCCEAATYQGQFCCEPVCGAFAGHRVVDSDRLRAQHRGNNTRSRRSAGHCGAGVESPGRCSRWRRRRAVPKAPPTGTASAAGRRDRLPVAARCRAHHPKLNVLLFQPITGLPRFWELPAIL